MASTSQFITIVLLLSCALLGGYASMGVAYRDGFFDAVRSCVEGGKCILVRSHTTLSHSYTGIEKLDNLVALLLEFFHLGLTSAAEPGQVDWEAILAMVYMAAPFGGLWALMVVEGLRKKNAGTVLEHTTIFGLIFQLVTVTIVSPIYLCLEVAQGKVGSAFNELAVNPAELDAIPWATTLSFVVPTIAMVVPLLNVASAELNYLFIALWQPFPLYQALIQPLLRKGSGNEQKGKKGSSIYTRQEKSLAGVYAYVLKLCAVTHLCVLGAAFLSQFSDSLPTVSLSRLLMPTSLSHPPTLAALSPPVSALDSREVVVSFLRWDIYCASAAFSIWAGYHTYHSERGASVLGIAARIVFWTVVGGPIAPAAVLLWDRDTAAFTRARKGL